MVVDVVDTRPTSLVLSAANDSARFWKEMNSAVHTGVKSPGWLKNTNHCPANSPGNVMSPCVVLTAMVGNRSSMSSFTMSLLRLAGARLRTSIG
jgi:hypothetical protein